MTLDRRICLFAHYDPRHRIRRHVIDYLGALRRLGFEVVLACSGGVQPPLGDRDALAAIGATLFLRSNRGHDFGAWQDLIRQGYADGASSVLLANDSVLGPFADLSPIITKMCSRPLDVWGMVESRQSGWHLQSWFLHFTAAAFAAPAVRRVFDQPFETMTKQEVIKRGELALGVAMRRERLRCDAVARYTDGAWMARVIRANPMHIDWHHLLVSGKVPFIKADLLRDNPMNIPWITEWPEVLRHHCGAAVSDISDYLNDYTGVEPTVPGQPFYTPASHPRLPVLMAYALISRDHSLAVRALLVHLASPLHVYVSQPRSAPI